MNSREEQRRKITLIHKNNLLIFEEFTWNNNGPVGQKNLDIVPRPIIFYKKDNYKPNIEHDIYQKIQHSKTYNSDFAIL